MLTISSTSSGQLLFGVQLDDELLLHRHCDLVSLGQPKDLCGQRVVVRLEPRRNRGDQLRGVAYDGLSLAASFPYRDDVTGPCLVGRDVEPPPVDHEVTVLDELTCLAA